MFRIGRISSINTHTAWIQHKDYNILTKMTHRHKPGDVVIYWLDPQIYTNNMRYSPFSINIYHTICIFVSIMTCIKTYKYKSLQIFPFSCSL